jgi:hypothetical protein
MGSIEDTERTVGPRHAEWPVPDRPASNIDGPDAAIGRLLAQQAGEWQRHAFTLTA